MDEIRDEGAVVDARIVYWGLPGAGKSANLRAIHAKLRPDHRGDLKQVPTPLDPTVCYDEIPIALGQIAGVQTQIRVVAVPGGPEHGPTRKQLLDQVDGVVFVVDPVGHPADETVACLLELREALASYGRRLEEIPLVLQYNKRDLTDSIALEDLHRRLGLQRTTVFESIASEGTAVLQTLTTISKRVIRALREAGVRAPATRPEPEPPAEADAPDPLSDTAQIERMILAEEEHPDAAAIDSTTSRAEALFDSGFGSATAESLDGSEEGRLTIASVGTARRSGDQGVRVPLILRDGKGREHSVSLVFSLEAGEESSG